MDPSDVAFIKGIVAFIALAGTGLTVYSLRLRARPRALPEADEAIRALRDENARNQEALESRIAELEERVHFTERLLSGDKTPGRLPTPDQHPPL